MTDITELVQTEQATKPQYWNKRGSHSFRFLIPIASIAAGVIIWQVVADLIVRNTVFLVSFTAVMNTLYHLLQTSAFWRDLSTSLEEIAIGYAISVVAGVAVGLAMGVSKMTRSVIDPWVSIFYVVPTISLAPLLIIFFGIGINSKVAMVILLAFFTIVISTVTGITNYDHNLEEMSLAFGGSRLAVLRTILLPNALPVICSGLRLGVGRAVIAVVIAEEFGASRGLGFLMWVSSQDLNIAAMLSSVAVLSLIGYFGMKMVEVLERKLTPWNHLQRT